MKFSGLNWQPSLRGHGWYILQCSIITPIRNRQKTFRRFSMADTDSLPHDGLIRKMWAVEATRYRDHLLRLDEDSRRSRFGGLVTDDFLARYAEIALGIDTVIHGFFINGTMRGAAELRPIGPALSREAEAVF